MNVEYINPFIKATINALSTMAFITPVRGDPYLKNNNDEICDISGTIGVAGEATGSVTINFPENLAVHIVSNMIGEALKGITHEVKDAVGEIANMIAGGAKGELSEQGYGFKIALPVVCVGKNHYTNYPKDVPCIVIPFEVDGGKFTVDVALKRVNNGK